MLIDCDRVSDH